MMDQQSDAYDDEALSLLYQKSRREEPSPALDRVVLRQASAQFKKHKSPWLRHIATAAILILGVSVTLQLVTIEETTKQLEDEAFYSEPTTLSVDAITRVTAESPNKRLLKIEQPKEMPASISTADSAPVWEQDRRLDSLEQYEVVSPVVLPMLENSVPQQGIKNKIRKEAKREQKVEFQSSNKVAGQKKSISIRASDKAILSASPQLPDKQLSVGRTRSISLLPPAQWLEKIKALYQQGKISDAQEELKHFKQIWPDYPLDVLKNSAIEPE
jgi:hypothetical protein